MHCEAKGSCDSVVVLIGFDWLPYTTSLLDAQCNEAHSSCASLLGTTNISSYGSFPYLLHAPNASYHTLP